MVSWPDNGVQDCVRLTCSELGIGVYSTVYIFCQLRKPARRGRLGDAVKNKRRAAKASRAQSRPTAPKRAVARSPRPAKKRSAGALHKLAHPKLGQSLTPDLGWPGPVFDVSPMPMPMPMLRIVADLSAIRIQNYPDYHRPADFRSGSSRKRAWLSGFQAFSNHTDGENSRNASLVGWTRTRAVEAGNLMEATK